MVAVHPSLGKVIAACFTRVDGEPAGGLAATGSSGSLPSVFRHALPITWCLRSIFCSTDSHAAVGQDNKGILHRVDQCMQSADTRLTRFVCSD